MIENDFEQGAGATGSECADPAEGATWLVRALRECPVGILMVDHGGRIAWANATAAELLAVERSALLGMSAGNAPQAHLQEMFECAPRLWVPAQGDAPGRWLSGHCVELGDAPPAARVHFYIDVTRETQLEVALGELSVIDPATGVLNYRGVLRTLGPTLARSRRYGNAMSVVVMEVTNMDAFQRALDPDAADTVMHSISRIIRDQMRWADSVGRMSEGRFLFVLPETSSEAAFKFARKMAAVLEQHRVAGAERISPRLQFGVAGWQRGDDASLLIERARAGLQEILPDE